jgi:hypothetical protein
VRYLVKLWEMVWRNVERQIINEYIHYLAELEAPRVVLTPIEYVSVEKIRNEGDMVSKEVKYLNRKSREGEE